MNNRTILRIINFLSLIYIIVLHVLAASDYPFRQKLAYLYVAMLFVILLSAFFCWRHAGSLSRSKFGWAIGGLLFPYIVPFILCTRDKLAPISEPAQQRVYSAPSAGTEQASQQKPGAVISPESKGQGAVKPTEPLPAVKVTHALIQEIIAQRQLRPLGNKKRLGYTEDRASGDYRAQFRDRADAEMYYDAFVSYAERNPPPMLFEVIAAFTPETIYAEKYAFILPYFDIEFSARKDYALWARQAMMICNEVVRQASYCSGNNYSYVPLSIGAQGSVFKWTILPPRGFDIDSPEAQELLSDPPDMGFDAVNIEGEGGAVPEKPNPQGPWIGVVFEIEKFSEAYYGRAATKRLIAIVGLEQLAGCVIHGGDLLPDARYWCNAIHTATLEQADMIADLVEKSDDLKLAQGGNAVMRDGVPVNILPFQGYVSVNGVYIGL